MPKIINGLQVLTVGDLIAELSKYDKGLPIIYSHDDEGNEYQTVNAFPSGVKIQDLKDGRFLEICECINPDNQQCQTCHPVLIIN